MTSLAQRRAALTKTYGPLYDRAHWPDAARAAAAERERGTLVGDILAMGARQTACGTKLYSGGPKRRGVDHGMACLSRSGPSRGPAIALRDRRTAAISPGQG